MKNTKYKAICYVLILSLVFPTSSCSILGFGIGAIKDKRASEKAEIAVVESKGWIEPDNKNSHIELKLTNDMVVFGKYEGKDYYKDISVIKVKSGIKLYQIPGVNIINTKIYPEKKHRALKGFFIGLGLDALLIAAMAAGGGVGVEISVPNMACCQ